MKESIVTNTLLTLLFGIAIIGGAASILEIYHGTKDIENSLNWSVDEDNTVLFV